MQKDGKILENNRILRRMRSMRSAKPGSEGMRKGFYLFPNLLTSASLLLGFYAISASFAGDFNKAAWAIFIAAFFDGIDGRVARLTNSTSDFGAQYDSLSDLVSFGIAPAFLMLNFALAHSFRPRIGWMIAFLYVVCAALRLARYNIHPTSHKRYFEGLPVPAAALALVFTVIFSHYVGFVVEPDMISTMPNLLMFSTLIMASFMVSTFPYYGFKDINLFKRHKFSTLLLFVFVLVVIFQEPEFMLFVIFNSFAFSGPVVWFFKRGQKNEGASEAA